MFNIYRGGSLIQDVYQQLGTTINHSAVPKFYNTGSSRNISKGMLAANH